MSQPEVKLEYEYSEAEYLAASRLLFSNSPDIISRLAVFGLLLGAAVILLSLLTDSWIIIPGLVFVVLLEVALFYNVLVNTPRKYFRGDGKFRDRYELTFSDEGVQVKTSQIDSKMAWSLYTKVVEGRDMYLLLYGKDTRMMTAVPKRVFSSNDQEQLFRELVTRHITDHAGLKPMPPGESEYKPKSLTPPDWR
jgi:YcxB-like protein